jgi:hypothetical protein
MSTISSGYTPYIFRLFLIPAAYPRIPRAYPGDISWKNRKNQSANTNRLPLRKKEEKRNEKGKRKRKKRKRKEEKFKKSQKIFNSFSTSSLPCNTRGLPCNTFRLPYNTGSLP